MHLLMKDLLKSRNSLNDTLKKNYRLIEDKWIKILKDNNVPYIHAYAYEHGMDVHELELDFNLTTNVELTEDKKEIIEKEACCKLTSQDKKVHALNYEIYFYTFTPLKIIPSPVENSWLKD